MPQTPGQFDSAVTRRGLFDEAIDKRGLFDDSLIPATVAGIVHQVTGFVPAQWYPLALDWRRMSGPRNQVDQGATKQQTYIFPVSQPEFRYYVNDPNRTVLGGANMGPDQQLDGATKQQTVPIPPVTTRPDAWFDWWASAFIDANRRLTGPRAQVDQGATNQQTYIFQPNQPEFRYYLNDPNRSTTDGWNVGPQQQFDGATIQQTYIFPPNQPEAISFQQRERARLLGGPIAQFDGATRQQTYIFEPNQPELSYLAPAIRALAQTGPAPQLLGVTIAVQQTYIFPPNEPEFAYLVPASRALALTGPRAQIDQGATIQATFPVPPVTAVPDAWFGTGSAALIDARRMTGPQRQLDGATAQQTYLFPVPQPEFRYYTNDPNRTTTDGWNIGPAQQLDGATKQQTVPVPPVTTRPDAWFDWTSAAYDDVNRRLTGPKAQIDLGAEVQQTYIFPVALPEFRYYVNDPNRTTVDGWNVGPQQQFDGATAQQTSPIPGVSGPEFTAFLQRERVRQLGGPAPQTTGATAQQTYIFAPNQPELAYQVPSTRALMQTGPTPQFLGVTVTTAQTSLFPPNQFEFAYLTPATRATAFTGPAPQFAGATVQPTFPVPPVTIVPDAWFGLGSAALLDARRMTGPRAQFDGAQATFPVPPVGGPEWVAFVQRERVRLLGGPMTQTDGATSQATFPIPPVTTRPDAWFTMDRRDITRLLVGPRPQFDGATIAPTYQFLQPDIRYFTIRAAVVQLSYLADVAVLISQQPYDFDPSEPVFARYLVDPNWYVPLVVPRLEGATAQQTTPIPGVSGPELAYQALERARRLGGPTPQFQGATIQDTIPVPPVNGPELIAFFQRERARVLGGPAPQVDGATNQAWFIYPPNQPEQIGFAQRTDLARRQGGPTPQLTTIQQTYIFPPNQPELRRYTLPDPNRLFVTLGPTRQVDGATVQQTYVFQPNQPEFKYYLRNTPAAPVLIFIPFPQTYEYTPNQPEMRAWQGLQIARRYGGTQVESISSLGPRAIPSTLRMVMVPADERFGVVRNDGRQCQVPSDVRFVMVPKGQRDTLVLSDHRTVTVLV